MFQKLFGISGTLENCYFDKTDYYCDTLRYCDPQTSKRDRFMMTRDEITNKKCGYVRFGCCLY